MTVSVPADLDKELKMCYNIHIKLLVNYFGMFKNIYSMFFPFLAAARSCFFIIFFLCLFRYYRMLWVLTLRHILPSHTVRVTFILIQITENKLL